MSRFGDLIRTARKEQGLSQAELAGLLHHSPQYLCDMELGRAAPVKPSTWLALSQVLGVPLEEIRAAVWEAHEEKLRA